MNDLFFFYQMNVDIILHPFVMIIFKTISNVLLRTFKKKKKSMLKYFFNCVQNTLNISGRENILFILYIIYAKRKFVHVI